MVFGAKRLGYGGETTRVENRGETTRGETTRGETSWGRNVLLPIRTPHYIPRHFSTPKNSILYNHLLVWPNVWWLIASILKFESPSRYLEANLRESWGRAWGVFSAVYIPLMLLDSDFYDIIWMIIYIIFGVNNIFLV